MKLQILVKKILIPVYNIGRYTQQIKKLVKNIVLVFMNLKDGLTIGQAWIEVLMLNMDMATLTIE